MTASRQTREVHQGMYGDEAGVAPGPEAIALTARAECRDALSGDAKSYEQWHVRAADVSALRQTYYRFTGLLRQYPSLEICDSRELNASFSMPNGRPKITFMTPIRRPTSTSVSMKRRAPW